MHPLEAKENWVATGQKFVATLVGGHIFGIVHGFVTQPDKSFLVLIWFNKTERYQQLRLD